MYVLNSDYIIIAMDPRPADVIKASYPGDVILAESLPLSPEHYSTTRPTYIKMLSLTTWMLDLADVVDRDYIKAEINGKEVSHQRITHFPFDQPLNLEVTLMDAPVFEWVLMPGRKVRGGTSEFIFAPDQEPPTHGDGTFLQFPLYRRKIKRASVPDLNPQWNQNLDIRCMELNIYSKISLVNGRGSFVIDVTQDSPVTSSNCRNVVITPADNFAPQISPCGFCLTKQ